MHRLRNALWLSLAINASVAVVELVFVPLHGSGRGQDVLGFVDGSAHILQLPGMTVAEQLGLRPQHRWTWSGFAVQVGVNLVFYWIVLALGMRRGNEDKETRGQGDKEIGGRLPVVSCQLPVDGQGSVLSSQSEIRNPQSEIPGPSTQDSAFSPPSRREWLLNLGRVTGAVGAGFGAWGFFVESRWFEINRVTVPIRGLPRELDGLRVVQLSDIHHSSWMSIRWLREIIAAANALSPDLVALTGDYVHRGVQYMRPAVAEFSRLRAGSGVVGVMGNHDWWEGGGPMCKQIFAEFGIPLIDNSRLFIDGRRRLVREAGRGLCIAGVGDLWEDKCLYDDALGDVPGGMPRILLSHNPDVAEEPEFLRSGHRVDLMLSGHTHGGQIALPVIGAVVTNSRYGQKYVKGLVEGPACRVFISKGLGMTVMPIRLGVRPEIVEIRLAMG